MPRYSFTLFLWSQCPLQLRIHSTGFPNEVLIKRCAEPVGYLKYAFSQKVSVSHEVLKQIADLMHAGGSRSVRAKLLEAIARKVFEGEAADAIDAKVAALLKADGLASMAKIKIDPLTELAWEELEPDDQGQFPHAEDDIKKKKIQRKIAQWRKTAEKKGWHHSTPTKKRKASDTVASGCKHKFAHRSKRPKTEAVCPGGSAIVTVDLATGPVQVGGAVQVGGGLSLIHI